MKKYILLAAVALTFGLTSQSFAQSAKKADGKEKLAQELSLTPDQQTKFDALSKTYKEKEKAIKGNASLSADAKKTQLKDLHKQLKTDREQVLTPDQVAKWKTLKHKKGHHGKNDKSDKDKTTTPTAE
jgi:periplasmic protein CpxP/Spy